MNKSRLMTYALIAVLLVLGACAWFMYGGVSGSAGLSYADADRYTAGGTTVTAPVENLAVNWTEGSVRIEYHAGSGIIVSETSPKTLSENDRLHWWLDGKTLRIQYAKSGIRFSWNLDKALTVSLPEDTVLKSADISSTSADITVADLLAEEIRLGSTSGSVNASTVTKRLSASSTSGDLNIRQDSVIDTVTLGSTSGSVTCVLDVAKAVTVESTSGGISLSVADAAGDVKLHSTSGSIFPELASVEKAEFSSTSGNIKGGLGSFGNLKAGTTSGGIELRLPAEPGFTCGVSSASGDFSSEIELAKKGNVYSCGDESASASLSTTSGNVRILK